jgi:hypothetical protein
MRWHKKKTISHADVSEFMSEVFKDQENFLANGRRYVGLFEASGKEDFKGFCSSNFGDDISAPANKKLKLFACRLARSGLIFPWTELKFAQLKKKATGSSSVNSLLGGNTPLIVIPDEEDEGGTTDAMKQQMGCRRQKGYVEVILI